MYNVFSLEYDTWTSYYDPQKKELALLKKYVGYTDKCILDIGCGTGRLSFSLVKECKQLVGIDNDKHSISLCNDKKALYNCSNCNFFCLDALNLPPSFEKKFDIVIFSWSLYQIKDMELALKNARKCLKDNGTLIVLQPTDGLQDYIFDAEIRNNLYNPYQDILNVQIEFCKNLFKKISIYQLNTEFVYPSIEEAIRVNSFFYKMFDDKYNEKTDLTNIQNLLKPYTTADGKVALTDIVSVIICKHHID